MCLSHMQYTLSKHTYLSISVAQTVGQGTNFNHTMGTLHKTRRHMYSNVTSFFSADEEDSSGPPETNVVLRYNGEITWDSPAITKSSCKVDVSYFPFDYQQCNLTFGSWTYNGNQVYALHRWTHREQHRKVTY